MNCLKNNKQGTEILLAYAAGTLDPPRAASLENHAAGCGECRELLDAQQHLWSLLDECRSAPDVSPDFDARLYARIAREESAASWKLRIYDPLGCVVLRREVSRPAASCGIRFRGSPWRRARRLRPYWPWGCICVFRCMLRRLPRRRAGINQQIRPEAVDAEQVEVTIEDLEMLMPPVAPAGRM